MSSTTGPRLSFGHCAQDFVLAAFGKAKDKEGYIVEQDSGERVLAPDGTEVRAEDFAGLRKGSEVFVKSDIDSLFEAADSLA